MKKLRYRKVKNTGERTMSVERDYKGLPEKYWHRQNFCWYMHDIIISIFHNCIEDDKMTTTIKFDNETHDKEFELALDKINWLQKNGYEAKAEIILGKKIFHAILADMFHFIYESLNTIEKGKIAVSLALLRKPFRDSLLYLEWLLGSPKEFIEMVNNQDIEKYAIEKVSREDKIDIIKNAIKKVDNQEFFSEMDDGIYFDLRYNYKAENSLQLIWNRANHLVTTGKNTKSNEFNFVFLDEEIHLDIIDYYYNQVPHLLFYTYNIVTALYNKFIRPISNETKVYNNSLIIYKLCDMMGTIDAEEYFNKETKVLLNFPCENCKELISINLNSKEFKDFQNGWSFTCPKCGNEITISKYVFWEDYNDIKQRFKVIK